MTPRLLPLLCLSTLALPALADSHFQGLAQDALGAAQTFDDYSRERADDVLAVPVEDELPQSDMTPSDLEESGAIAAAGDTIQGRTFSTIGTNIGDWSVGAVDQGLLATADAAVADPDAIVSEDLFSTSGGICTVDEFSEGPVFERVCTSQRDQVSATCTETAFIEVPTSRRYACLDVSATDYCSSLNTSGICTIVAQTCGLAATNGGCLADDYEYLCSSSEPFSFPTGNSVLHIRALGPYETGDPIITWNETCEPVFSEDRCYDPQGPVCTVGPSVEDINGVLVPMDCTERETAWTCLANTYSSDCDVFESDGSCSLISSECFSENPDGQCGGYENTFRCGSEDGDDFDASCEAVNVCVGGSCQSIPNEQNDDLISALVAIETLNTMAEDSFHNADPNALLANPDGVIADLNYFSSRRMQCRIGILGTLNCCRDSGWALGTIAECDAGELELYAAQEAGSAVYLETYCSEEFLFVCAQRARRYCVFNSRLAKIVSYQGQRQLYGDFACRAMTQEELEAIDWTQIDFTETFGDLYASVGDINPTDLSTIIQNNIILAHPEVQDVYE